MSVNKKKYIAPNLVGEKIKINFFQNVWWTNQFDIVGDVYAQSDNYGDSYSETAVDWSYGDSYSESPSII